MNYPSSVPSPSIAPTGPSFTLALGAGGARGLAHIPVIEVLDELGLKPVAIAGASIGAIIGACYSAGMSGKDIREFFLSLVTRRTAILSALMAARVGKWKDVASLGNPFLIDGTKLLEKFWPAAVPDSFSGLRIPLQVVVTDFHGRCETVYSSGALLPVVAASMAIPGAFQPVIHQGRVLVDGGTVNPLPFDLLKGKAPFTIAVDVTGGPAEEIDGQPSGFEVMFGALQLLQGAIVAEKLKNDRPQVLVRPPIDDFRVLDFFVAEKVLEASEPVKDELKRQIEAQMTGIRA